MRHLTRIHFDNSATSDKYVAFVDGGIDDRGHPRFNYNVAFVRTAGEMLQAMRYLLRGAVFFKLPVGATATVDVLVPDVFGSSDPKIFDYKVSKSKFHQPAQAAQSEELEEFLRLADELVAANFPPAESEAGEPAGPNDPSGFSGPSGATSISACSLHSPSGSCGGQTERPCLDPLNTIAACVNDQLECVSPFIGKKT